jgi:cysteinyl-tRNA synthetase
MSTIKLYNTHSRSIENFESITPGKVGMYICGPTVYGPPHLGHVRGPIVFDVFRRLLLQKGYQVRFVRNITDVGHLVGDADDGEDKLQKQARIEQIEPMEVAQAYTDAYHWVMDAIHVIRPSIEPKASGHIMEQIEMIQNIISKGLAYEVNGSVYFDVMAYSKAHHYGSLSGRVLEDLVAGAGSASRELEGQNEKRSPHDFALWKKANPEHLMQWTSPWGKGYPGWHIECSAMSAKYLGETFDIHGGGMDLLFPHHECEIAQSTAAHQHEPAKYWMHHNMITINGQKMAKSLNNGIKVSELFDGTHPLLNRGFGPDVLRFFVLQAHYRSTLDFSEEALEASEKGLKRLIEAWKKLPSLPSGSVSSFDITKIISDIEMALAEDLNTPIAIAQFFELSKCINLAFDQKATVTAEDIEAIKKAFEQYFFGILGIPHVVSNDSAITDQIMEILIDLRSEAKIEKNYALSDAIRNRLKDKGIELMDSKEGTTWKLS